MRTNKFTNQKFGFRPIQYLSDTKLTKKIVSLLLAISLLTAQPLAAFSWGIGGYLTSAYSAATGCAEQLKNNFKTIATTAVVSVAVGHTIGSNELKSSVLIAIAGILICHALYSHWDQAEKRRVELVELEAKSSVLKKEQEKQIQNLSAAKEKAEENTGAAESLKASIAEQTGQVTGLEATITGNTAELGKINQAAADTSAAIATGLNAAKEAAIGQVTEHTTKLAKTIEAQVVAVTGLSAQAQVLRGAQETCAGQVTAASKQLEATNIELRKLTTPAATGTLTSAPVNIVALHAAAREASPVRTTSPVPTQHTRAVATSLPAYSDSD